jgi:hypothetical protein
MCLPRRAEERLDECAAEPGARLQIDPSLVAVGGGPQPATNPVVMKIEGLLRVR